jgi:hypothetical protein
MVNSCFNEKESNPPVCAVHRVPLLERQLPDETIVGCKGFTILVCPVSGTVPVEDRRIAGGSGKNDRREAR